MNYQDSNLEVIAWAGDACDVEPEPKMGCKSRPAAAAQIIAATTETASSADAQQTPRKRYYILEPLGVWINNDKKGRISNTNVVVGQPCAAVSDDDAAPSPPAGTPPNPTATATTPIAPHGAFHIHETAGSNEASYGGYTIQAHGGPYHVLSPRRSCSELSPTISLFMDAEDTASPGYFEPAPPTTRCGSSLDPCAALMMVMPNPQPADGHGYHHNPRPHPHPHQASVLHHQNYPCNSGVAPATAANATTCWTSSKAEVSNHTAAVAAAVTATPPNCSGDVHQQLDISVAANATAGYFTNIIPSAAAAQQVTVARSGSTASSASNLPLPSLSSAAFCRGPVEDNATKMMVMMNSSNNSNSCSDYPPTTPRFGTPPPPGHYYCCMPHQQHQQKSASPRGGGGGGGGGCSANAIATTIKTATTPPPATIPTRGGCCVQNGFVTGSEVVVVETPSSSSFHQPMSPSAPAAGFAAAVAVSTSPVNSTSTGSAAIAFAAGPWNCSNSCMNVAMGRENTTRSPMRPWQPAATLGAGVVTVHRQRTAAAAVAPFVSLEPSSVPTLPPPPLPPPPSAPGPANLAISPAAAAAAAVVGGGCGGSGGGGGGGGCGNRCSYSPTTILHGSNNISESTPASSTMGVAWDVPRHVPPGSGSTPSSVPWPWPMQSKPLPPGLEEAAAASEQGPPMLRPAPVMAAPPQARWMMPGPPGPSPSLPKPAPGPPPPALIMMSQPKPSDMQVTSVSAPMASMAVSTSRPEMAPAPPPATMPAIAPVQSAMMPVVPMAPMQQVPTPGNRRLTLEPITSGVPFSLQVIGNQQQKQQVMMMMAAPKTQIMDPTKHVRQQPQQQQQQQQQQQNVQGTQQGQVYQHQRLHHHYQHQQSQSMQWTESGNESGCGGSSGSKSTVVAALAACYQQSSAIRGATQSSGNSREAVVSMPPSRLPDVVAATAATAAAAAAAAAEFDNDIVFDGGDYSIEDEGLLPTMSVLTGGLRNLPLPAEGHHLHHNHPHYHHHNHPQQQEHSAAML